MIKECNYDIRTFMTLTIWASLLEEIQELLFQELEFASHCKLINGLRSGYYLDFLYVSAVKIG